MAELHWMSAFDLARSLEAGEVSAAEAARALIARAEAVDGDVKAFVTRTDEGLLAGARASDDRRGRKESRSSFDGVPLAYKDIFVTRGITTTAGSQILEDFVPPFDATVVARCGAAGLPIQGKTNMDEFAMGSSTENSSFFDTRNPWDLGAVPGGSSGGSAAAVAAGITPWAWGTDTGGSVRQPASLCGIVGVKPTYGLVSRYGMIAFASSLDQAGPLTRTVRDAAALLEIAAGHDPLDATSIPGTDPRFLDGIDAGIDGMRLGVVAEFMDSEGLAPGVRTRVEEAYRRLEKLGAELVEVHLPVSLEHGISAYYLIAPAEASANLARYDGVRYGVRREGADIVEMMSKTRGKGFGDEVKRRIMLGTYSLSAGYYDAYYGKAQRVRTLIKQEFDKAYGEVDLIVSPTSPTTAFRLGERTADPLAMYLSDLFTVAAPLAGLPAVSVPCGLSPDDGLPVGLQLMARALDEATMFRGAYAFEQDLGFGGSEDGRPQL
jgi:aspartyl-tRNA(Asn)/glutamyl-tRNA(Gln) amidotransferase subunit A